MWLILVCVRFQPVIILYSHVIVVIQSKKMASLTLVQLLASGWRLLMFDRRGMLNVLWQHRGLSAIAGKMNTSVAFEELTKERRPWNLNTKAISLVPMQALKWIITARCNNRGCSSSLRSSLYALDDPVWGPGYKAIACARNFSKDVKESLNAFLTLLKLTM